MMKRFRRATLSRQLAVVSCLILLVPMLLLWYTILRSQQDSAIQTRAREAQSRCIQMVTQAERAAELCNMSSQVFLNTPALVEHLNMLTVDIPLGASDLLEFYRQHVSSLEKITLSNPYLYQTRVYSNADDITEMMPILYSARRMDRMPWAQGTLVSGSWYLDFDDQLFADYPVTPHIMSLVTVITTSAQKQVGVLEVAVRMDEVLPDLFEPSQGSWSVLLDGDGGVAAGQAAVSPEELASISFQEGTARSTLEGKPVLVTQTRLKDFGCTYLQVTSLTDIYRTGLQQGVFLLVILLAAAAVMLYAVSQLTRRMLRGFYRAFDGIRAFADGDTDAMVEVTGEGEVAAFAREAGGLLDQLRQLMRDNIQREAQIQRAETRALQNQINAHFIYNVLEAIKMMAEIDEEYEIADAVTALAKLLRYSMKLESGGVMLERELDYIQNYITLMDLRFDYVISLCVDMPPELLGQKVPKISLQPIVENAVVHGAAALAADTTITVRGTLDAERGRFSIQIIDEGCGMDEAGLARLRRQIAGEEPAPAASTSGNGIGLGNVQARIRMAFGEEYGLQVDSEPGRGTTVSVTLPYMEKTEGTA
ncbi:MAG: histidine kinase [Clostridiales bacterium]|nr:histidine kinase [Clostridiales bacterium]